MLSAPGGSNGVTQDPQQNLRDRGQACQGHRDLLFRIVVVLQLACLIVDVGLHVEVPVPAKIKENRPLLSFFLGAQTFRYVAIGTVLCSFSNVRRCWNWASSRAWRL